MARMVDLISDEDGQTRSERKLKTNAKLAALVLTNDEHRHVLLVKLADRLFNVMQNVHDVMNGLPNKLAMYQKEHPAFREAVYRDDFHAPFQQKLDELLAT
jgi:(p)ppGpp synthase/HD superfamily hydrolase